MRFLRSQRFWRQQEDGLDSSCFVKPPNSMGVMDRSAPAISTDNVRDAARDRPRDQSAECRQSGANLLFSIPHVDTFGPQTYKATASSPPIERAGGGNRFNRTSATVRQFEDQRQRRNRLRHFQDMAFEHRRLSVFNFEKAISIGFRSGE